MPEFTKTQQRILDVLSDGRRHQIEELKEVLLDKNGEHPKLTIRVHLSHIRKKLNPIGEHILCEIYKGKNHYRHVRLISTGE